MEYQLMHGEIPVVSFALDDATSAILRVGTPDRPEHLPVGVSAHKNRVDRAALNAWWQGRAIPASRQGIRRALDELGVATAQSLLEKCLGLSLSDQYWIRPAGSALRWSEVNFFEHPFSDDVGNILFGRGSSGDPVSLMSPDNTSDGWLKKKWTVVDGKRCLLKGGSGATQQEPYNEVFASRLMRRLQVPHVEYALVYQDGYPFSVCEDFITPNTELVSAWYVMQTRKKENHISVYQHLLQCCAALGIPDVRRRLDEVLAVDYLLVNEDRHQNNFGFIRRADTLEWLGMAPIYDSGSSLWFNTPTPMIRASAPRIASKPFKVSHEEQIKLVSSFAWIDWDALNGIEEDFRAAVQDSPFLDGARCDVICRGIAGRVERLKQHARQHTAVDDLASDLLNDTAYSGKSEE
mgnify:FL=1